MNSGGTVVYQTEGLPVKCVSGKVKNKFHVNINVQLICSWKSYVNVKLHILFCLFLDSEEFICRKNWHLSVYRWMAIIYF